jgi:phage/plasmid-like protein (TIGR03299 family)
MTTDTLPEVYGKVRKAAWHKAGIAVEATSASEVASQAGLDWTVSLHDITATYTIPGENGMDMVKDYIPIENKKAVIKTDPYGQTSAIGVVGNRYKVFQNAEIFGALDNLIDSAGIRYAAAGEYDGGAKVWMLMETPMEMTIANDPHSAFLLARTSHDGSSSVLIKPVIERLFCMNQINKIYNKKNKYTYSLNHTSNAFLSVSEIANIVQLTYDMANEYTSIADMLLAKEASHEHARNYFKRVFPMPTKVEQSPYHLLSTGEKKQFTNAINARTKAFDIYSASPTQENIRNTEFGMWHAVVEWADYNARGKNLAVSTMAGRNDGVKTRALELLGV